ncbi:MAG: 2-amino-4-hydroxy-6-hydroxymethyldihydropteridine diphosphokinase, partial [Gammaproteobacteria bacterium]
MTRVYVSVGSNIERDHNIHSGLAALRKHFSELIASSLYESKAYGFEGDNFYNLVVAFDTDE